MSSGDQIVVYLQKEDQTGDILTVPSWLTILDFLEMVRQTQQMGDEPFELYFKSQKLEQVLKTLEDYSIADRSKIQIRKKENSFFSSEQSYFLVVSFKNETMQINCHPKNHIYSLMQDIGCLDNPQQKLVQYVLMYNGLKMEPYKKIQNYQIPSGSIIYLTQYKNQIKPNFLQSSVPMSESFYIPKLIQPSCKNIVKKPSKIRLVCSGLMESNFGEGDFDGPANEPLSPFLPSSPLSPIVNKKINQFLPKCKQWINNMKFRETDSGSQLSQDLSIHKSFSYDSLTIENNNNFSGLKCNEIELTESFCVQDGPLSPTLITPHKKFAATMTNQNTGQIYRIHFQEKNTIKQLKTIIADLEKTNPDMVKLINEEKQQEYSEQAVFKDILEKEIEKMVITID